jgi:hypothetical protein
VVAVAVSEVCDRRAVLVVVVSVVLGNVRGLLGARATDLHQIQECSVA